MNAKKKTRRVLDSTRDYLVEKEPELGGETQKTAN